MGRCEIQDSSRAPSMKQHKETTMAFEQYRCLKCGDPINQGHGWCIPCRILLKRPGMIQEKCLTCNNPVKLDREFCGECLKKKMIANGETFLENFKAYRACQQ